MMQCWSENFNRNKDVSNTYKTTKIIGNTMFLYIKNRYIREEFLMKLKKTEYGYYLKTSHDIFKITNQKEIDVIETYIKRREMINEFTKQPKEIFNYE